MLHRHLLFSCLLWLVVACSSDDGTETDSKITAQTDQSDTVDGVSFGAATEGMEQKSGFFTVFVDEGEGRVLAALPKPDDNGVSLRFIYATGLTAGLGSNPVGLDRGAFDSGVIVSFRQIGDKLVAEQENWKYRASADRPLEKKAVRQSFAPSFLWATDILETAENGALLIDLSGFLTRDHFGVAASLKNHGGYKRDGDLSMPDLSAVLAFPDNVELDAFLTFTSSEPGVQPSVTAADGRSVTLSQHHSFVRLPAPGFQSRPFDGRTGAIEMAHYDFSAPLDEPIVRRVARRFRLEKTDPTLAVSPVKKPIVFYVDPGAPEQIRDALIDGAMWWADAFEAAGFENAYRVELLPEDAHPFDIRYNMIQWVHRQTRGWSYGGGVADPRTGEMLKANVILGSQRVRQDRMIFEGLAGAEKSGTGAADDPVEIALSRIRQLSAHEVGHTLGFAHNFAASTNDRASVMDYPAPLVRPVGSDALDFSQAYGVGIGEWDKFATKWLYASFPEGVNEADALEQIIQEGYAKGLRLVGDRDARSVGTGHPYGAVWDNGDDPVSMLIETMQVRKIALNQFGLEALRNGAPQSNLNNVIVPIYLYHRYQVAAAAKLIGGVNFTYGVKGSDAKAATLVSAADQRAALQALLRTLDPAALDLPERVLNLLTPPFGGYGAFSNTGETFDSDAGPIFDNLAAADTAANVTISALLHPQRAARLVSTDRRDQSALGLRELLDALEATVFLTPEEARLQAIANVVQTRLVSEMIALASNENAAAPVRHHVDGKLRQLQGRLRPGLLPLETANGEHRASLLSMINAHLNRPADAMTPIASAPETPPGSPIGDPGFLETCWFCEGIE